MNLTFIENCEGFDWDSDNIDKNQNKHQVTRWECEQSFFNEPLLINPDERHSQLEPRYFALGQTDTHRLLMIVFTVRCNLIRVISARPMSAKERKYYEQAEENS